MHQKKKLQLLHQKNGGNYGEFILIITKNKFDMRSILIHNEIMKANFKKPFSQYIKKAHKPLQLAIEDAVEDICANPSIGEAKVGDLAGIWVYKFKFNRQEYLIAYKLPTQEEQDQSICIELLLIDFYKVGSHENFYDELKRYLKEER